MSLFHLERNPTTRQLRQFGGVGAAFLLAAAWWQRDAAMTAATLAVCGLAAATCTVWRPRVLRRPFVWLSAMLFPIGLVVGEAVLAGVYFLVFTPIALVFRLLGRDALDRSFDAQAATYWQDTSEPPTAASYFRQY